MKKHLLAAILLAGTLTNAMAQLCQASLGMGTSGNNVKLYIKTDISLNTAQISTLQFNLAVSATASPQPTVTVVSNALSGVTWEVKKVEQGGFINYQIFTASSPLTPVLTANQEFEVMELSFTGGIQATDVLLLTLPDGGDDGNSLFYCTGGSNLASQGNNLYYTRDGVMVNNGFSYDVVNSTPGSAISSARISQSVLPVKWLSINAKKIGGNAIINWEVANFDNADYFEVSVSGDGRNFSTLGRVAAGSQSTYSFTDSRLHTQNTSFAYYKIKQVDKDGKYTISEVRKILLGTGDLSIKVVGNPIRGNTLQLGIQAPTNSRGMVKVVDVGGRILLQQNISWGSGYSVQALRLPPTVTGNYVLQLFTGDNLLKAIFTK